MTLSLIVTLASWFMAVFTVLAVIGSWTSSRVIKENILGAPGDYKFVSDHPGKSMFLLKVYSLSTGLVDELYGCVIAVGDGVGTLPPNRVVIRQIQQLRPLKLSVAPVLIAILSSHYGHDVLPWIILTGTATFNGLDMFWVRVGVANSDLLLEIDGAKVKDYDDFDDPGYR